MRAWVSCLAAVLCGCGSSEPLLTAGVCAPGTAALERTGSVSEAQARTYQILPFEVGEGSGRVELSYQWIEHDGPPVSPVTATTLDLGLWDEKGYRNQAGFRGWSGSRQGRIDQGDPPIFVQADGADRGFSPGAVIPGTWYAELGIAAVSPQGADWRVRIECKAASGARPADDPVDPAHVASLETRWYHGDFHMHAYHSNEKAPEWDEFVALARAARLDFLMVTEYVTGRHWQTLGAVQRANPDLLIWPGREVITYFGHVNVHGETFGFHEYRHGFEDVDIGSIQDEAKARGALFQVNHPTIFPPPTFSNFCRGCYFELIDQVDWNRVDTLEVLTAGIRANATDAGAPGTPGEIEQPFVQTAIDLWEERLSLGYKVAPVSGSDSKGTEATEADRIRKGYGSSATAVYAAGLSRAALTAAIEAGHVYVRTLGVERSPAVEYTATAGAQEGMFGDTLTVGPTDAVTLRVTVTGGAGQLLRYLRNGETFAEVPIPTDPFVSELSVTRAPAGEGPLGTFWGIETIRQGAAPEPPSLRTTIGNPIFLKGP